MADLTAAVGHVPNEEQDGSALLRRLTTAGGVPGIAIVILAILALAIFFALGVWGLEKIASGFEKLLNQALIGFTAICVMLALVLLIAPVRIYLTIGQRRRLDIIKGYYSPGIIARYFEQFWAARDGFPELLKQWRGRSQPTPAELDDKLRAKFDELLRVDFGSSMYAVPLVLLLAVAAIVMYFGFLGGFSLALACAKEAACAGNTLQAPLLGIKLDLVSIAAIFGAYTWVVSDSITRGYQATFHPADLLWYALRLIVAVPLGHAISMLSLSSGSPGGAALPGWGAFLAFAISMFSLDAIAKYLSIAVNKLVVNTQPGSLPERDDLVVKLPGVDEEIARRLAAEGVSTIAQLVSVDPVRLSIRSGLSFDYLLGLVDAAILWTYVGGKITTLREFGFKGASNVLAFSREPGAEGPDLVTSPLLQDIAAKTGIPAAGFANIVAQLRGDDYADFVCRLLDATDTPPNAVAAQP